MGTPEGRLSVVPPLLTTREIARACGWATRRVRRELHRVGLLEQARPGAHFRVSSRALRTRLPDVFDMVVLSFQFGVQKD